MSPSMAAALDRIACATSVLRVRRQDGERAEVNGGTKGDLVERAEKVADRLERVAEKLEEALA